MSESKQPVSSAVKQRLATVKWRMVERGWRFYWSLLERANRQALAQPRLDLQQLHAGGIAAGAAEPLRSALCKQSDFESPNFGAWCAASKVVPRYHRKQWEFYFIWQALRERGLLESGKRGLGFGVGREPLPALFANAGCELVLTDMGVDAAKRSGWVDTHQHATRIADLNVRNICPQPRFLELARFEEVDMNAIPAHLRGFDFCWSSCALEHLGSIDKGLHFIHESLRCLRPGGIAVHTTEFNVRSARKTLTNGATVLFRRCDLERLRDEFIAAGHAMVPLDLDAGAAPLDQYIDLPPYCADPHLKLALSRFVTTSVGIIVVKGATATV